MGRSIRVPLWRIVSLGCCLSTGTMGFEDGTDACETACPGISALLTSAKPFMDAKTLEGKEAAWNLYCENKTTMDCATSSCDGTLVLGHLLFKSFADELSCVCGSCPDVVKFKEIQAHLLFSQTSEQEWDYGCPAVSTVTCMKQSCAAYYDAHSSSIKNKAVFQTTGADNCTALNLSTSFPGNWTVPAWPPVDPRVERCQKSCPDYMAMTTKATEMAYLRDYDGAQNLRCGANTSTNQCMIDDPDCYALLGLNRFSLTKDEEMMQFDCGCGTCPNVSKALAVLAQLSTTVQSQYMSVGCQAVDTLDCVTTSVACKSTAANLQTTIQMFPTARRDCENEGYPTNFGEMIPDMSTSTPTRSHWLVFFGALSCAVLSFS